MDLQEFELVALSSLEDDIKNVSKDLYDKILEKLKDFNTYIDDIVVMINEDSTIKVNNIYPINKTLDKNKILDKNFKFSFDDLPIKGK